MATVTGTTGNDSLVGTTGNDTISGLGGNDTLNGNGGSDFFDGGAGFDSIDFRATAAALIIDFGTGTVSGGLSGTFTGIERVQGGTGNDSIIGAAGGQNLAGQGGNDTLWGAAGNDTLWGGAANDQFVFRETGSANADTLGDFASGADKIVLDASFMTALGAGGNFGAGDGRFAANASGTAQDANDRVIFETDTRQVWYDADGSGSGARQLIATLQSGATLVATDIVVQGGSGGGVINGTSGNDSLAGTENNDTINGLAGNDTLSGGAGDDQLDGGTGNDLIHGGSGADLMIGGDGNDTMWGATFQEDNPFELLREPDTMTGGLGDDEYNVDSESDAVADSGGTDTVVANEMGWTLGAGIENLLIRNDLSEHGFDGIGNDLDNVITYTYAGGRLEGLGGNDTLIGASGEGTSNHLLGGDGDDSLEGADGSDTLEGGQGDDTLSGGMFDEGSDMLIGGGGADTFVVADPRFAPFLDNLADFASGIDKLQFDGTVFDRTGRTGNFAAGDERFFAAAGATSGHDDSDRVVFDTATGNVYYDSDGSGAGSAILVANVSTLAAADIVVANGNPAGATISGTAGNDSLVGTAGDDTINGLGGNDTLDGRAGDDVLDGGAGHDRLIGTDGNDILRGQGGNDTLEGGSGTSFDGGLGDDTYLLVNSNVVTDAGGFDQVITTSSYDLPDDIENLTLRSDGSSVSGFGNRLDNIIRNEGSAAATLSGLEGDDTLIGGVDDDVFSFFTNTGDFGSDVVDGGAGIDRLVVGSNSGAIVDFRSGSVTGGGSGGSGSISFINIEEAFGGSFDDRLIADDGGRTLGGGWGNDTLIGGAGNDNFLHDSSSNRVNASIDGGAGTDSLVVSGNFVAVSVNLGEGRLQAGTGNSATLLSIENFTGSQFAYDFIVGSGAGNVLIGLGGDDTIDGGGGNDTLIGGSEEFNSIGNDTFVFSVAPSAGNADLVRGFISGDDTLRLDGRVHANAGPSGEFTAGDARFAANSSGIAQDGTDRVIYNTSNGQLWYDADGNGSGARQLIATLETAPSLAATDISIVNGSTSGSVINGTAGNDTLSGTSGNDTINGLGGNDLIQEGSGGNDVIDGGAGSDSIEFKAAATSALVANFATGSITGSGGSISFSNIERVVAGNFNDQLTGAAGGQNLAGQAGADTLAGGAGADTLWGGTGNDAFIFREMGSANADKVSDFTSGGDKLQLDDSAFTAIGALGNFAAGDGRFFAAAGASSGHDVNDRVIYNTSTGALYYDADGSGSGAAQLVATLTTIPTLAATDIAVI